MHTVQELQEHRREAAALAGKRLCPPVAESVAKRQPLLLHQQPEAIKGPVVRIRQQLDQGHHLQPAGTLTPRSLTFTTVEVWLSV